MSCESLSSLRFSLDMARAHELSFSVPGEEYPVRAVDRWLRKRRMRDSDLRWYLRTRADLQLDGNTFGGYFLDTTMPLGQVSACGAQGQRPTKKSAAAGAVHVCRQQRDEA